MLLTWVSRYLSPPPAQSPNIPRIEQLQRHENTIDRTHLKRVKYAHHQDMSFDSDICKPVTNVDGTSSLDTRKNKQDFSATLPDFSLELPNKLTKTDFEHAKVLGQVDKKYIAIKLLHSRSLIMIDQHAADERIKLEYMLKHSASIATLEPPIAIDIDSITEFRLLTSERISKYLKIWGIHIATAMDRPANCSMEQDMTILSQSRYFNADETSGHFPNSKNRIYVTRIPQLIVERCVINHDLLKALIQDHVYWMVEQKDESALIKTCPKGIMEILKSKACRSKIFHSLQMIISQLTHGFYEGAIMFNDKLTLNQCETIVRELAKCNFPFQCAHGRYIIPTKKDQTNQSKSSFYSSIGHRLFPST